MICLRNESVLEDSMHKCTMSHVSGWKTGISHYTHSNIVIYACMHKHTTVMNST